MEDWWQGVEFDAQYYDDDWLDFSPVDDPEVTWENQGEADGPPTVGSEQLEKIEAESRQRELSRLLEMGPWTSIRQRRKPSSAATCTTGDLGSSSGSGEPA